MISFFLCFLFVSKSLLYCVCLFIYFFFPHSLLHTLNLLQPSFLTFPFFFLFRLLVSFFAADSSCRTPVLQSPFFFSPFIFPVYLNTQTSCTSFFCFSSCFSSPPTPPPPPLCYTQSTRSICFFFFRVSSTYTSA